MPAISCARVIGNFLSSIHGSVSGDDLLGEVFKWLGACDLAAAEMVCHHWYVPKAVHEYHMMLFV